MIKNFIEIISAGRLSNNADSAPLIYFSTIY